MSVNKCNNLWISDENEMKNENNTNVNSANVPTIVPAKEFYH